MFLCLSRWSSVFALSPCLFLSLCLYIYSKETSEAEQLRVGSDPAGMRAVGDGIGYALPWIGGINTLVSVPSRPQHTCGGSDRNTCPTQAHPSSASWCRTRMRHSLCLSAGEPARAPHVSRSQPAETRWQQHSNQVHGIISKSPAFLPSHL